MKLIKLEEQIDHDIFISIKGRYEGLICPHGTIDKYQLVFDGRHIGYAKTYKGAIIKFLYKYLITRIFRI